MLHFFAFFAPWFVADSLPMALAGGFILLSGPVLAEAVVRHTRLEAAATWCFWAVGQSMLPLLWDYYLGPRIFKRPFATWYDDTARAEMAVGRCAAEDKNAGGDPDPGAPSWTTTTRAAAAKAQLLAAKITENDPSAVVCSVTRMEMRQDETTALLRQIA